MIIEYTVERGDTLSSIARRHNTTYQEIARQNNLSDPNKLAVGQKLRFTMGGGGGKAPSGGGQAPSGRTNRSQGGGTAPKEQYVTIIGSGTPKYVDYDSDKLEAWDRRTEQLLLNSLRSGDGGQSVKIDSSLGDIFGFTSDKSSITIIVKINPATVTPEQIGARVIVKTKPFFDDLDLQIATTSDVSQGLPTDTPRGGGGTTDPRLDIPQAPPMDSGAGQPRPDDPKNRNNGNWDDSWLTYGLIALGGLVLLKVVRKR